jgi:hypothetical protein
MSPAIWYEYNVTSNTWDLLSEDPLVPAASTIANGTNMLVLPNGQILVSTQGNVEVYNSTGSPNASW